MSKMKLKPEQKKYEQFFQTCELVLEHLKKQPKDQQLKYEHWAKSQGSYSEDLLNEYAKYFTLALVASEVITQITGEYDVKILDTFEQKIEDFDQSLRKTIADTAAKLIKTDDTEYFYSLYPLLIEQPNRRNLGQFWTPHTIADLMAKLSLYNKSGKLDFIDPAAGTGVFALSTWNNMHTEQGNTKINRLFNNFTSHEIAPHIYAANKATTTLAKITNYKVILEDFLAANRVDIFADQDKRLYDCVICNPPYSRHHVLPELYKNTIRKNYEAKYGVEISRLSSLFVYFFFASLSKLKPEGRMVFIVPSVVFEAKYSSSVKDYLLRSGKLKTIITFQDDIFNGVDTAGCIFIIENQNNNQNFSLVNISSVSNLDQIVSTVMNDKTGLYEWGSITSRVTNELEHYANWTREPEKHAFLSSNILIELSEIAKIMRGIATGKNDYFILNDEELEEYNIDKKYVKPVVTRNRDLQHLTYTSHDFATLPRDKKRWLLDIKEYDLNNDKYLQEYVQRGIELGVNKGSLVKTRKQWYFSEQREPAPILFTYLSRAGTRFIYNEAKVQALNTFTYIYPHADITSNHDLLLTLLAILNSHNLIQSLGSYGRAYGGGTIKLEPREMDRIKLINPLKLPISATKQLAKLFAQLNGDKNQSKEIDAILANYF
jgi:type I restriction-modification system DNA methylase subunit